MRIYLAYSENYHDILLQEKCRLIISYGRKHGSHLEPSLPSGFSEFLIDSGGFQIAMGTTERDVSVSGYCLWLHFLLEKYGDMIHGYMSLDVGRNAELSYNNYLIMRTEGLSPIPVWHDGEDEALLREYCDMSEYVAIGGLVGGFLRSKSYYRRLFERIKVKYPEQKFHMLGIGLLGVNAFRTFRPYSVDFSTWNVAARFGHDIIYDKKQLLKEVKLPEEVRMRLRNDKGFEEGMVRQAVKKVLSLETELEKLNDPWQPTLW